MTILLATREGLLRWEKDAKVTAFRSGDDFMALARAPSTTRTLYAASRAGRVYRSEDGGRLWDEVGGIDGWEELSTLAVDPRDPNRLLAGMEPSALFRSIDGGRSWEEDPAIRSLSERNGWSVPWSDAKGHVRSIAWDESGPNRIYLAIEVGGVVRTEDGGATWENARGGIHDDVHSVAVRPDSPVVYAATRHGFGRSDDYGATWTQIDGFEGQGYCRPLAVHPEQPNVVFTTAATTGPGGFSRPDIGAECGIFRSRDGGRSWVRMANGIPARFRPYVDAIDIARSHPESAALADSEGNLYLSDDTGDTWHHAGRVPPVRRLLVID